MLTIDPPTHARVSCCFPCFMQVYALVSREKTVLAEYTASSGNFPTVTRVLLSKIPSHDGRMSYVYDKYVHLARTRHATAASPLSLDSLTHRV